LCHLLIGGLFLFSIAHIYLAVHGMLIHRQVARARWYSVTIVDWHRSRQQWHFQSHPKASWTQGMTLLICILVEVIVDSLSIKLSSQGDFMRHIETSSKANIHIVGAGTKHGTHH
jgi:hypothetical protein